MKALILAAGFGTRLRPYTANTPKPLFSIFNRPILDFIILNLQKAGCRAILINTHHLHQKITSFIARQNYSIPVQTRYEPEILGTGGAIRNAADFWDDQPFLAINSDIVTNIDLKQVYNFHLAHNHPVTLVLYDDPEFNTVTIDKDFFVKGFQKTPGGPAQLTFTGIQVIDPGIVDYIPEGIFSSSIDLYENLLSEGLKIKALLPEASCWKDIGTAPRYRAAVMDEMGPAAFKAAHPDYQSAPICYQKLKGDGSDRSWYRLTAGQKSIIMADHGIRVQDTVGEVDAFILIGRHLYQKGLPVPEIYLEDNFAGLVFLEDLGDVSLQEVVQHAADMEQVIGWYQTVIHHIFNLSVRGAESFHLSWAYQTPYYDRQLILQKECRYFVEAFLNGYLGLDLRFTDFEDDFFDLADKALKYATVGFMHRDMQSRNIMVKNDRFYFIDFQGGRIGPVQYDLASLLIDPYVQLPVNVQSRLLDYVTGQFAPLLQTDPNNFSDSFRYCAISRNLQILGAFGYLSRVKGKTYFEQYVPGAIASLKYYLESGKKTEFTRLKSIAKKIGGRL
ncbi:MAG: sugar phosphate nucleotidyltransferase [Desulfobacterales bacterium]|nr:sugar phosphate nucleotidyltransferase [Desulfobacterales bacterium]